MNTLYYGDNLKILRDYIPDKSVDLIYLDPPFNSKRAYNQIFRDKEGKYQPSQIEAFNDTWKWGDETEIALDELKRPTYPAEIFRMLRAFREFLGETEMTAYLVMMAIRLFELHRVLKDTGSIYLHCDPTASHYLKILMDQVFGVANYKNEIIWKRTTAHSDPKRFGRIHDVILFYAKSSNAKWETVYTPYDDDYIETYYRYKDEKGRSFLSRDLTAPDHGTNTGHFIWKGKTPAKGRMWAYTEKNMRQLEKEGRIFYTKNGFPRLKQFLEDMPGMPAQSIWTSILNLRSWHKEALGYPTQKPQALLERIIQASSNEGDIVLDPFCGCGTTIAAAEKLGRGWIGIDITVLAINLIEKRLRDHYPDVKYELIGIPRDVQSAKRLARDDKFDFEKWFVTTLDGQPHKSSGGGDKGIDGFMYFDDVGGKSHTVIVQVKGGSYSVGMIRDLCHVVDRENASMGLLLALNNPTQGMLSEASAAGRFQMPGIERTFPKIQIFTVEDFFAGKRPDLPDVSSTLKKAKREIRDAEKQKKLEL